NIAQPLKIAGLAYGSAAPEQWASVSTEVDFYDVKGDLEALFAPQKLQFSAFAHVAAHPGRCAQMTLNGQVIGWLGQLHPRLQQKYDLPRAPMLFELDAQAALHRTIPTAREVSKQQMVTRDLALILPKEVSASAIDAVFTHFMTKSPQGHLLREVQLFDLYQGEHVAATEKSMAYRVSLQDMHETLQDATIDALMAQLLVQLQTQVGARLR
ncbi:MAG: phenylalanine--tRNA ligase subunit beta, partial [Formosimonas sp.]